MAFDIPCGTLCSYAEASSLLSSKAGHLLTVSSLTAALRASGKDFSVEPVYLGLTKGAENGDENLCARCLAQTGRRNSDTSQKRVPAG